MLCMLPTTKSKSLYNNISKDLIENNSKPGILYLLFEGQRDTLRYIKTNIHKFTKYTPFLNELLKDILSQEEKWIQREGNEHETTVATEVNKTHQIDVINKWLKMFLCFLIVKLKLCVTIRWNDGWSIGSKVHESQSCSSRGDNNEFLQVLLQKYLVKNVH